MSKLIEYAESFDFTNEYELFDYIIDSMTNGNRAQTKRIFEDVRRLRALQEFKEHVKELYGDETLLQLLEYVID